MKNNRVIADKENSVAAFIRIRQNNSLTQTQMAKMLSMPLAYICGVENGTIDIDIRITKRIRKVFDIHFEVLQPIIP